MNGFNILDGEMVELVKGPYLNGFPFTVVSELPDIATTELAAKLKIPFPIPKYAIIENGSLYRNGDKVKPQEGKLLQYSLLTENKDHIQVCVNIKRKSIIGIVTKAPYFDITDCRAWTLRSFYNIWSTQSK